MAPRRRRSTSNNLFRVRNSIDVRCDTLHRGRPLSRPWLGLEGLNVRFTHRVATALHCAAARCPAALPCACPRLVPAQQGNSRETMRSTSPFATIRNPWGNIRASDGKIRRRFTVSDLRPAVTKFNNRRPRGSGLQPLFFRHDDNRHRTMHFRM